MSKSPHPMFEVQLKVLLYDLRDTCDPKELAGDKPFPCRACVEVTRRLELPFVPFPGLEITFEDDEYTIKPEAAICWDATNGRFTVTDYRYIIDSHEGREESALISADEADDSEPTLFRDHVLDYWVAYGWTRRWVRDTTGQTWPTTNT